MIAFTKTKQFIQFRQIITVYGAAPQNMQNVDLIKAEEGGTYSNYGYLKSEGLSEGLHRRDMHNLPIYRMFQKLVCWPNAGTTEGHNEVKNLKSAKKYRPGLWVRGVCCVWQVELQARYSCTELAAPN